MPTTHAGLCSLISCAVLPAFLLLSYKAATLQPVMLLCDISLLLSHDSHRVVCSELSLIRGKWCRITVNQCFISTNTQGKNNLYQAACQFISLFPSTQRSVIAFVCSPLNLLYEEAYTIATKSEFISAGRLTWISAFRWCLSCILFLQFSTTFVEHFIHSAGKPIWTVRIYFCLAAMPP